MKLNNHYELVWKDGSKEIVAGTSIIQALRTRCGDQYPAYTDENLVEWTELSCTFALHVYNPEKDLQAALEYLARQVKLGWKGEDTRILKDGEEIGIWGILEENRD